MSHGVVAVDVPSFVAFHSGERNATRNTSATATATPNPTMPCTIVAPQVVVGQFQRSYVDAHSHIRLIGEPLAYGSSLGEYFSVHDTHNSIS